MMHDKKPSEKIRYTYYDFLFIKKEIYVQTNYFFFLPVRYYYR